MASWFEEASFVSILVMLLLGVLLLILLRGQKQFSQHWFFFPHSYALPTDPVTNFVV